MMNCPLIVLTSLLIPANALVDTSNRTHVGPGISLLMAIPTLVDRVQFIYNYVDPSGDASKFGAIKSCSGLKWGHAFCVNVPHCMSNCCRRREDKNSENCCQWYLNPSEPSKVPQPYCSPAAFHCYQCRAYSSGVTFAFRKGLAAARLQRCHTDKKNKYGGKNPYANSGKLCRTDMKYIVNKKNDYTNSNFDESWVGRVADPVPGFVGETAIPDPNAAAIQTMDAVMVAKSFDAKEVQEDEKLPDVTTPAEISAFEEVADPVVTGEEMKMNTAAEWEAWAQENR